jgi:thioredoxin-like negative regulator of GroEL
MGYPGDYFEFPTPDINYPLPYIVSNGGFVREGFEKENFNVENFNVENNKNTNIKLKLFYVDWCGHCTKFKPIFDGKLKQMIQSLNIPVKLEAIDCDKNPDEANKNNISSYPTLILEVNDKLIKYEGEREAEKIIEFIKINIENNNTNTNDSAKLKLYYTDWCGHCTKFKPIFDGKLKQMIKSLNIPVKLEAIDCDKNPDEANKNNISGYPTLILEVNDKLIKYEGDREAEKIIEFIKKNINM